MNITQLRIKGDNRMTEGVLSEQGTKCEWHKEKIDALEKVVNGNGSDGLVRRVERLQTRTGVIIGLCTVTLILMITAFIQNIMS